MRWRSYRLDDTILRTIETTVLWQTEKGLVEIGKDSLAVAVKLDDETEGYIFKGDGKFLLDAIIETREGAIGKSVEKQLTEPFIMLGPKEAKLSAVSQENLEKMGYANEHEFLAEAGELLSKFEGRREVYRNHGFEIHRGLVFAFPNEDAALDILVVHDSHLIYRASEITFVSNGGKSVLKSPKETVCVDNGRLVVVKGKDGSSSFTSVSE